MNNIFKFKNEQQGLNTEEFRVSVTSVEGFEQFLAFQLSLPNNFSFCNIFG